MVLRFNSRNEATVQALSVSSHPRRKRQACSDNLTTFSTTTIQPSPVTVSVSSRSTISDLDLSSLTDAEHYEPKHSKTVIQSSQVTTLASNPSTTPEVGPSEETSQIAAIASTALITPAVQPSEVSNPSTTSEIGSIQETSTITNFVSTTVTVLLSEVTTPASTASAIAKLSLIGKITKPIHLLSTGLSELPSASGSALVVGFSASESISTSSVTANVSVITTAVSSGTAQILPITGTQTSTDTGIVISSLTTSISAPVQTTTIPTPTSLLTSVPVSSVVSSVSQAAMSGDIFQPVATDAPPSVLGIRPDHPAPRLGIQPQSAPISTNKFYANFFLGSQTAGTWTHPYSVAWSKGGGSSGSWGISIQHIDDYQKVFGPNASAVPAEYFINPIGIQSLVVSEVSLGSSTNISIDTITAFSANVNLLPSTGAAPVVTFPLVQGMGFITAIYYGGTPILQTGVFFQSIMLASSDPKPGVTKYTIVLNDGKTWYLYAYSPAGDALEFTVVNNGLAQATSNFNGIIQISKDPGGAEALYDTACGVYATSATISGTVNGATGMYTLSFEKAGMVNETLTMFALPHHLASFDSTTSSAVTSVALDTTTKGLATAVVADSWTLVENLPTTMDFAPWSPTLGSQSTLSAEAISVISSIAAVEVSQDMSAQTNLNSMYYSGKALAKFAQIVYTINDLLDDPGLAQAGLANLKACFAVFASNTQDYPLVYETAWGGVVSTASYVTGNSGVDFGNTYYNDHHFHYGYFIYTAAVIGTLDPTWLAANQDYVNAMVRDIANPSTADNYFPVSRMFDWYHGHSWAHGLYETFDGKDEESSAEDSMSAYAIKMWGKIIGDANMEARGNLQLAVTARSLQNYFLYTSNNVNEPANFIGNMVSGILFENKIDHTTYFGANIEYIEGIHMLPLLPSSTLTRTQQFVTEEWNTYFSNGRVDSVVGGWKGILYANLAIIDPTSSWNYFSQADFDTSTLDGGASQTWYLALAAGLGGAPA